MADDYYAEHCLDDKNSAPHSNTLNNELFKKPHYF